MARIRREPGEPTEKTPKGYEVPIPKRGEFFDSLKKIAKPKAKRSATDRPEK